MIIKGNLLILVGVWTYEKKVIIHINTSCFGVLRM